MAEASQEIARFLEGLDGDAFVASELHQSAVAYQLLVLEEAARRVSPEYRAAHAHVSWREAVATRTVVAHDYDMLDWQRVWFTAAESVPALLAQLVVLLEDEEAP